jgi:hypothetical protein
MAYLKLVRNSIAQTLSLSVTRSCVCSRQASKYSCWIGREIAEILFSSVESMIRGFGGVERICCLGDFFVEGWARCV